METLNNSLWDVVIAGTGIQQSLLALALSRSGKKVLHVDRNDFYGGSEACLSLQEAEKWADNLSNDRTKSDTFRNASVRNLTQSNADGKKKLSTSRSYNLALAPELIYTRSKLLSTLVSAKVHRQLEFLPIGSWWIHSVTRSREDESTQTSPGTLNKIPSGREDVFVDDVLNVRAKRGLMKFLRFIADYEEQGEVWEKHRQTSFLAFLAEQFKLPRELHQPLLALTLSSANDDEISVEYALPRIARHIRSIGVFGPGFGSILPKWGGLAEIAQVACRSGAVGGAVYVLGQGITGWSVESESDEHSGRFIRVSLQGGETVSTGWLAGAADDLRNQTEDEVLDGSFESETESTTLSHSVSIVSSRLAPLFPSLAEGSPSPAGAVVVFPPGSFSTLEIDDLKCAVTVFVHSSDSGECPRGQCVLYASTARSGGSSTTLLDEAVSLTLRSVDRNPSAEVLWSLHYEQSYSSSGGPSQQSLPLNEVERVIKFPRMSPDLAFDDLLIERVRHAWQLITGRDESAGEFMVFEDREGMGEDDEDET